MRRMTGSDLAADDFGAPFIRFVAPVFSHVNP
jgi:hypothetical protein